MTWGKDEAFLRQVEQRSGVAPPALQNKPKLLPECIPYLNAYFFLDRSRGYNEAGRQPLLISEIHVYLTEFSGITGIEQRETYLTLLQSLDSVALSHYADQAEKALKRS